MAIVKRMVVPPGKNAATEVEYFDDETGRVVPTTPELEARFAREETEAAKPKHKSKADSDTK